MCMRACRLNISFSYGHQCACACRVRMCMKGDSVLFFCMNVGTNTVFKLLFLVFVFITRTIARPSKSSLSIPCIFAIAATPHMVFLYLNRH